MPPAEFKVLTINPGSTSTKIGVYANERPEWVRCLSHSDAEMEPFRGRPILDQLPFRRARIEAELTGAGYAVGRVRRRGRTRRADAPHRQRHVSRERSDAHGSSRSLAHGEHASNMGAFLAQGIARRGHAQAFVVDPVSVDEFSDKARISGTALAERHSLSHALNTKAVAKRYAREQGKAYADLRLVIAHLGSGISVSAHEGGRMVDVNLAGQEGPMSTERSGGLQCLIVVQLCFSGRYTQDRIWNALFREGGIYSYLGTKDLREVERRIAAGDERGCVDLRCHGLPGRQGYRRHGDRIERPG